MPQSSIETVVPLTKAQDDHCPRFVPTVLGHPGMRTAASPLFLHGHKPCLCCTAIPVPHLHRQGVFS